MKQHPTFLEIVILTLFFGSLAFNILHGILYSKAKTEFAIFDAFLLWFIQWIYYAVYTLPYTRHNLRDGKGFTLYTGNFFPVLLPMAITYIYVLDLYKLVKL